MAHPVVPKEGGTLLIIPHSEVLFVFMLAGLADTECVDLQRWYKSLSNGRRTGDTELAGSLPHTLPRSEKSADQR